MKCTCKEFEEKYPDCTYCSRDRIIVAKDPGNSRKYILNNLSGKKVCKVEIDNCVITSQDQRKCDYLIIICPDEDNSRSVPEALYFIELKGNKFTDSVRQLTQAIEYFNPQVTEKVFARSVPSQSPPVKAIERSPDVVKLQKKLKKINGKSYKNDDFKSSSEKYEERI